MGQPVSLFPLPFILMTEGCACVCNQLDFFVVHFPCTLYPSTHPLIFQTCFKVFLLFSKACANSGAGIIHMATRMHLGVTLPQAVHHPPWYLCIRKCFLSMQLESEIPCQLIASFSCPFFFVCRAPISAQFTMFLSKSIVFFPFSIFYLFSVHIFFSFFHSHMFFFCNSWRDNKGLTGVRQTEIN